MRAALDAALVLAAGRARPEVELALSEKLHAALDRGYQAGQLLAIPELLAKPAEPSSPWLEPRRLRSSVPATRASTRGA